MTPSRASPCHRSSYSRLLHPLSLHHSSSQLTSSPPQPLALSHMAAYACTHPHIPADAHARTPAPVRTPASAHAHTRTRPHRRTRPHTPAQTRTGTRRTPHTVTRPRSISFTSSGAELNIDGHEYGQPASARPTAYTPGVSLLVRQEGNTPAPRCTSCRDSDSTHATPWKQSSSGRASRAARGEEEGPQERRRREESRREGRDLERVGLGGKRGSEEEPQGRVTERGRVRRGFL
jgi:hypothetical protein